MRWTLMPTPAPRLLRTQLRAGTHCALMTRPYCGPARRALVAAEGLQNGKGALAVLAVVTQSGAATCRTEAGQHC